MGKPADRSPLAPEFFPNLPVIEGVEFSSVAAGVKYSGRDDVMLVRLVSGTTIAGVFTKSSTRSAPVLDCQAKIGSDPIGGAAIVVNSGNANAFTGRNGIEATAVVTKSFAKALDLSERRVFSSSTGVIGEPLAHDRITEKVSDLVEGLADDTIERAAHAIMTTDTFAKGSSASFEIGGRVVKIAGIAKGSGMIAPDMATMLVYIFTDAAIDQKPLQSILSEINEVTFNCITVDSDTSTSDTVLLAATGTSGVSLGDETGGFVEALQWVMRDLAHQVVRDGEGATKFVEVTVTGAMNDKDARIHALSIANSPLVKTAIAGEDPNWGRVVMAIGKSGAPADRDLIDIKFGDVLIAESGWVSTQYDEEKAAAHMKQQNIKIMVNLGMADGNATVWTCDLSHGYITINADYRS